MVRTSGFHRSEEAYDAHDDLEYSFNKNGRGLLPAGHDDDSNSVASADGFDADYHARLQKQLSETAGWREVPELGGWSAERGAELSHQAGSYSLNERLESTATVSAATPVSVSGPMGVFDYVRGLVSQQKLRYRMDGFNLDLRYITPSLIAMAYPAERTLVERITRNHIDEVVRFCNAKYKGKVLIMNLVGEADECVYDFARFPRVCCDCAFLDHSIPTLVQMQVFCQTVDAFLKKDPANCVLTHCKTGKGRTGVMLCAYLLWRYPSHFTSAGEVMRYYSYRRMRQAVDAITVASQRRYVGYFSQRFAATPGAACISRVVLPNSQLNMSKLRLEVCQMVQGSSSGNSALEELVYSSKSRGIGTPVSQASRYIIFDFSKHPLRVTGDVALKFYGRKLASGPFTFLFRIWFNTGFLDHTPIVFDKACLDKLPVGLKKTLPPDFHVQVLMREKPRVRCSVNGLSQARVYCWDCATPFLSAEASNEKHVPNIKMDGAGVPYLDQDGPVHRFHPLVEEDCSSCLATRLKQSQQETGGSLIESDGVLRMDREAEEQQRRLSSNIKTLDLVSEIAEQSAEETEAQKTYSDVRDGDLEQQLEWKQQKEAVAALRRNLFNFGASGNAPKFGYPEVFCPETGQFLCRYCAKHGLHADATRFVLPMLSPNELRYTGCARQDC